jgi:hypothetical protein
MAETVEELTIEWEDEDGVVTTKELDKVVLSKGAWTTIMFLYQDFNRKSEEFGPNKVRIQRYQKRDGRYMPRSKFNISSGKQARAIIETLEGWFADE